MPLYKRQELEPHMNRSQAFEIISFPPEIPELAPHKCQSSGFIPLRSRHQLKSLAEPQGDKNDQGAIQAVHATGRDVLALECAGEDE